jgi:acetoacetyl-CoA synthetase
MRKPLWTPSKEQVEQANVTRFIKFITKKHNLELNSYNKLYKWSVENIPKFWAAMWEFGGIQASQTYKAVVDNVNKFPGAKWFTGARLNFAENLLKHRDEHLAFTFIGEKHRSSQLTYRELYDSAARLAKPLRELGVTAGDRVAAYMPC